MAEMENQPWGPHDLGTGEIDYEERITLWRAPSVDAAIAYAEAEAARYVEDVGGEALGFAQAYSLGDDPGHGVEVFLSNPPQFASARAVHRSPLRHRDRTRIVGRFVVPQSGM